MPAPLPTAHVVSADPARLAQFRAAWAAVGLPAGAVEEWGACVVPGDGSLGNAVAQYALVRHALASGLPGLLVFEDDAVPRDGAAADLPRELAAAAARGDSAVRLGWIPLADGLDAVPAGGGRAVLGSHAWALLHPAAMADWCDAWPRQGKADMVWAHMRGPVSCSSRNLFLQHVPRESGAGIHTPPGWKTDLHLRRARADYLSRFTLALRAVGGASAP